MLKKSLMLASMLFVVSCATTSQTTGDAGKVAQTEQVEEKKAKKKKKSRDCGRKVTGSRFSRC